MTCSCPMKKLFSKTTQPSRRCGWRDPWIAWYIWCHRDKRDAPDKAAERWSRFGGQLDVARLRERSAVGGLGTHWDRWRMERALAHAGRCPPRGRSYTVFDAAVPIRGECPTNHHIWPDMDANETTRQRRRAGAGRDSDGGGRWLSV